MKPATNSDTPPNPVRRAGSGAPKPKCKGIRASETPQPSGSSQKAKRTRRRVAIGPALTRERGELEQEVAALEAELRSANKSQWWCRQKYDHVGADEALLEISRLTELLATARRAERRGNG